MDRKKYSKLKLKTIGLRKNGLIYNEIKKEVNVAKSTLSLWLKTISLTPEQRKRLYTKSILILARGPQSQKERRIRGVAKTFNTAEKEICLPLSFETYCLIGAALYLAEGKQN